MYCVLVTDKKLGGTSAYGPYRTLARASLIVALFTDPYAVDYFDPEIYEVKAAIMNKAE